MAWIIRRRKRDDRGDTVLRYWNQDEGKYGKWVMSAHEATAFPSQNAGRNHATVSGITFTYGDKNVDVVQMLEPVI